MKNSIEILRIFPETFRANLYTTKPFRMIGLIEAEIRYDSDVERVTLAYYRSSGTNDNKIQGLWYPIVGIKTHTGKFTEFTSYINSVMTDVTRGGMAKRRWLAKSLFFAYGYGDGRTNGFSGGSSRVKLYDIGINLRLLYESGQYKKEELLNAVTLNSLVMSNNIYVGNKKSQVENYERFIKYIYSRA